MLDVSRQQVMQMHLSKDVLIADRMVKHKKSSFGSFFSPCGRKLRSSSIARANQSQRQNIEIAGVQRSY